MPTRWRYVLGEVGIGLRRNLLMTVATILVLAVTVTMVGVTLLVNRQVNLAQRVLYADVEVSIFLTDAITPEQRDALETDLRGQAVVSEVIYESKEQAFANAQELFADDPAILEGMTPEVLPASFRVHLSDPEEFEVIASLFSGRPGIEDIRSQNEILQTLFDIMGQLRKFAFVIAVLIAVAAVMLVATTIRLTAYARREQTAIMKLVGATNWYIRLPFVLEGVAASVIGSILSFSLLRIAVRIYIPGLQDSVQFIPFIDGGDVLAIFPLLLIGAILVGAITSIAALHRFLAV